MLHRGNAATPHFHFMAILLDTNARILVQGAGGGYGQAQLDGMRAAGGRVVALVSPGRGGTRVGDLPVFDTAPEAVAATGADTSALYVPPLGVRDALVENADAGIRLCMVAAEYVPLHDSMRGLAHARERGMWVVGPNCVGMASPGRSALGSFPPAWIMPGPVGLMGRSGTLTLFTARLLTRAGIGQTSCISMGGDVVIGRNPAEYLREFLADPETRVVAALGEIGGGKEYEMLDLIAGAAKPVATLIVGRHAPAGQRMGHAGALVGSDRDSAGAKRAALREAGAHVADSPFHLVEIVKGLLGA